MNDINIKSEHKVVFECVCVRGCTSICVCVIVCVYVYVCVCDEASPRDMAHVSRSSWTLCAICALSPKSFSLQLFGFCRPSISPQLIYKVIICTGRYNAVKQG